MDGGTQIVPRTTIAQICAHRDHALKLYAEAHRALLNAKTVMNEAIKAGQAAAPTQASSYNFHSDEAKKCFMYGFSVPDADEFVSVARRLTDIDVWAHLIEITNLGAIMDKTAKDQLRQQLRTEPPEATEENIRATLEQFQTDSGMIFRRGVAECFSRLDRRFRSHNGWKIGSRIILSNAFDEYGSWSFHRNHRDTIVDIERAFHVIAGTKPPEYGGLVHVVEEARRGGWGRRQTEVETEFFTLRVFKNGNAHLWFKRDDLLREVNKLIGEYYGRPIPEERRHKNEDPLSTPKTSLAKKFGFYPTPPEAAARVLDDANLHRRVEDEPLTVLEPSAGTGNLAFPIVEEGAVVDCVEYEAERALGLERSGKFRRVLNADFLLLAPETTGLYDRVVMNPPFDLERDIDHVVHAFKFLKPDGFLVAIMSAGTEFRETKKSMAFRAFMEKKNAKWRDLPERSFSSVGTNVNTVILRVYRDGRTFW